ncbi:MAG: D-alanyl-D-alanine carboxypeptidase [Clostridia bacterium]|nr:D-alanyl-D-alanine carboxypeptidase [Clostridia bacterium]
MILTILFLLYVPAATVQADSEESSYYYIVIDKTTGMILLEQNSHERIFPASTTKVLTAYTALQNAGITSVFTASPVASGPMETGAVRLGLLEGEQMQLYDMLHALMLKSANDVAVAIAENISGSVEEFCILMNETALEAGALDTNFTNPNGLHDDNHYTTVYDLAMITLRAMDNFTFETIVARQEFTLSATNLHDEFPTLRNSNPILGANDGYDYIVTGVKTGYTSKAKFTLVSSARDYSGRDVICVVANIPSRSASAEFSLEIMQRAFDEYAVQSVTASGKILESSAVPQLDYAVATAMNIEYLMPVDSSRWHLSTNVELYPDTFEEPELGSIVGLISYKYDGIPIGSSYLVSAENLTTEKESVVYIFNDFPEDMSAAFPLRFLIPFSGFALVLFLLFFFRIRYNKNKARSDENAL